MGTAKLQMSLHDDNVIVEEIDGNHYAEYEESAFYVAAQNFGMKNADEATGEEVLDFLNRKDGKEIEVDPDFWTGCPEKSERPEIEWETAPIDCSA